MEKIYISSNSDVKWASEDFISLATLLFVKQPVQETQKKTPKLRTSTPLWGETTGNQWNLHTMGQQCKKSFIMQF